MNEKYLISELKKYSDYDNDKLMPPYRIRAMMNRVLPLHLSEEFYKKQDEYLSMNRGIIININQLEFDHQIALYEGDITLIKTDAIVNAGNSQLLGCFYPLHNCIDNCIHSYAGLQVRRDLMNILKGREVANAEVVVTKGYNLPSRYIFHTVGPIYNESKQNEIDLRNCYLNCLKKADEMKLESIVFCSLSTGVFGYPIEKASKIAVETVKQYIYKTKTKIKVIFDLFSKEDLSVYERTIKKSNGINK